MAQSFINAFEKTGHQVNLASAFRSWHASSKDQHYIFEKAQEEINRLTNIYEKNGPPDLWFTYHLYHKAPDWIGPPLCQRFNIPYCVAEASLAPKQKNGPWHYNHIQVIQALQQSKLVFTVNPVDRTCIIPILSKTCTHIDIKPFLDLSLFLKLQNHRQTIRQNIAKQYGLSLNKPWLVTTGMMRPGAKQRSYTLITSAVALLSNISFEFLIIGDGPARSKIEPLFHKDPRIHFLGQLKTEDIPKILTGCDLYAWPSIDEAFGYGILEAQAAGLPVISGKNPGVANIICDGKTGILTSMGETKNFATALTTLLNNRDKRVEMGQKALKNVVNFHNLDQTALDLDRALSQVQSSFLYQG